MTSKFPVLRLGTRGSMLAVAQSTWVARELERRNPGLRVELVTVQTTGDQITDKPLHAFGGKGLFTKELEQALLAGTVDFAVHSFKDVPVTMPLVDTSALVIAAVPPREDARDCWVNVRGQSLQTLPAGAKVGTGSLRRMSQVRARRPDLVVEPIRGNIDTRLRKLREGQYDAIILATAGLNRASLFDPATMTPLEPDVMLPAAGQGALALECRRDDTRCQDVLRSMHDEPTAACVNLERRIVLELDGDCHSPIAAYATIDGVTITLSATVGQRDGGAKVISATSCGPANDSERVVVSLMTDLRRNGAEALLKTP